VGYRSFRILALFVLLMAGGTFGYSWLEGWPLLDSLYMTVITVSTVGFGELRPLSPLGKVFTSVLILFGVGTLAYGVGKFTEALVERPMISVRRMRMEIKRMRNHVIVCGYGRMGATVGLLLQSQSVPIIVLEKEAEVCGQLKQHRIPYIVGDATDDAVLSEAGVQHARALAASLPSDADNLFVTLTARRLNPQMTIITRSTQQKNNSKMLDAGATRVVNPYRHGGRLMAQQLLQPNVTEFIDVVSQWGGDDLSLEEVQLQAGSSLAGVPLREAPIRKELDVIVVGLRRPARGFIFNPSSDQILEPGDIMIVLGRRENLRLLAQSAAGAPA
jgi:voltage-gated potassium channel